MTTNVCKVCGEPAEQVCDLCGGGHVVGFCQQHPCQHIQRPAPYKLSLFRFNKGSVVAGVVLALLWLSQNRVRLPSETIGRRQEYPQRPLTVERKLTLGQGHILVAYPSGNPLGDIDAWYCYTDPGSYEKSQPGDAVETG